MIHFVVDLDENSRKYLEALMSVISEKIVALKTEVEAGFARGSAAIEGLTKELDGLKEAAVAKDAKIDELAKEVANLTAQVGDTHTDADIAAIDTLTKEATDFVPAS